LKGYYLIVGSRKQKMGLVNLLKLFGWHSKRKPLVLGPNIPNTIVYSIDQIDWKQYGTAYGPADNAIPLYLKNLFSSDISFAADATHQLWGALCHQHVYIFDAALPAYEFLKKGLIELNDDLKTGILDIFKGFAYCTSTSYSTKELLDWERQLRDKLLRDRPIFNQLTNHLDADIVEFANEICVYLNEDK
jgi:hypothetical protein